ncbi:hypothetical protein [Brucella pituitosa]
MTIEDGYLSKDELEAAVSMICEGEDIEGLSLCALKSMLTIGQYLTDRCLNEIEQRGELEFIEGAPVIDYVSNHVIETILTRRQ